MLEIFKTYGVTPLRNASVLHDHQGQTVNICGVDDIRLELDDYPAALGGVRPGFPTVLVSHNPEIHHQIQEADGIDLILSGHTHGGQIRFGRFGLCEIGGTGTVFKAPYLISNGYGTSKLPLRLGARPETHLIKLVPGPVWKETDAFSLKKNEKAALCLSSSQTQCKLVSKLRTYDSSSPYNKIYDVCKKRQEGTLCGLSV